jgi:hypothetical protein
MLRVLACVIAFGFSLPALAGERSGVRSRPLALVGLSKDPVTLRVPAPSSGDADPEPFMLPAGDARLERLPAAPMAGESRRTLSTASGNASWGPGASLPEITARAGGSYAVHDIIRDQPRRRHPKSPLSAAFVLKLDGNDDSPAFSVGGGGVAAAVWQAMPK